MSKSIDRKLNEITRDTRTILTLQKVLDKLHKHNIKYVTIGSCAVFAQ